MPGRKRPTPEDAMTARRALLDGLARDADIFEVLSELALLHAQRHVPWRGVPSPRCGRAGVVRGQPGRAAAPAGTARAVPARGDLPRTAEREVPVRSAGRSGCPRRTEPDLLDEVASWPADDFWQYAMY